MLQLGQSDQAHVWGRRSHACCAVLGLVTTSSPACSHVQSVPRDGGAAIGVMFYGNQTAGYEFEVHIHTQYVIFNVLITV